MKVYVDQSECISCALCVDQCPAVFGFNSDNKSEVQNEDAVQEHSEQVKISAYECPSGAIKIM